MLKNEERIAEVKRRIAKKEQQQRLRRRRIISAVCIAACFAVIVGISFAMPGIIGRVEPGTSSGCYPVGFLYEWYSVSERSKTDIFPADLLLRLLCPWLSLLDAVSASVF